MGTIIQEAKVREAIRKYVDEGTPEHLQELSDLLCERKRLKRKKLALYQMIASHQGILRNSLNSTKSILSTPQSKQADSNREKINITGTERKDLFRRWRRFEAHRKKAIVVEYLASCEKIYSQEGFLKFIDEKLTQESSEIHGRLKR